MAYAARLCLQDHALQLLKWTHIIQTRIYRSKFDLVVRLLISLLRTSFRIGSIFIMATESEVPIMTSTPKGLRHFYWMLRVIGMAFISLHSPNKGTSYFLLIYKGFMMLISFATLFAAAGFAFEKRGEQFLHLCSIIESLVWQLWTVILHFLFASLSWKGILDTKKPSTSVVKSSKAGIIFIAIFLFVGLSRFIGLASFHSKVTDHTGNSTSPVMQTYYYLYPLVCYQYVPPMLVIGFQSFNFYIWTQTFAQFYKNVQKNEKWTEFAAEVKKLRLEYGPLCRSLVEYNKNYNMVNSVSMTSMLLNISLTGYFLLESQDMTAYVGGSFIIGVYTFHFMVLIFLFSFFCYWANKLLDQV